MAIAYLASASASGATGSTSCAMPTGVVSGNLMLAYVVALSNTTISPPSGWTILGTQVSPTSTFSAALFYKYAGAGEAGPYIFTSGAVQCDVLISAFSGANSSAALTVTSGSGTTSSTTAGTASMPAVGIVTGNSRFGFIAAAGTGTPTTPSGYTSMVSKVGTSPSAISFRASSADASTGTGVAVSVSTNSKSVSYIAFSVDATPVNTAALVSAPAAVASLGGGLTTAIQLVASPAARASLSASIADMVAAPAAQASMGADLLPSIGSGQWVTFGGEGSAYTGTPGTLVRYGANPNWIAGQVPASGIITFNNTTFGDPAPGVGKEGDIWKPNAAAPAAVASLGADLTVDPALAVALVARASLGASLTIGADAYSVVVPVVSSLPARVQPQRRARLRRSSLGVVGLWLPGHAANIAAPQNSPALVLGSSANANSAGPVGRAWRNAPIDNNGYVNAGWSSSQLGVAGSAPRTMFVTFRPNWDGSGSQGGICGPGPGGNGGADFNLRTNGTANQLMMQLWGNDINGLSFPNFQNTTRTVVVTYDASSVMTIWDSYTGAIVWRGSVGINTDGSAPFIIGNWQYAGYAFPFNGDIYQAGIANRSWTDDEVRSFLNAPWSALEAPQRDYAIGMLPVAAALVAAPAASASLGADLTVVAGSGAPLVAAPAASSAIGAALSTQIVLSAAPAASAALSSSLSTTITLAAVPAAVASAGAVLSTQIKLAAVPAALASLGGLLSTQITLAAAPAAIASAGAALSTQVVLAASPAAQAAMGAALSTAITLAASPAASALLGATLAAGSGLYAAPAAQSSLGAALSTQIALAASPASTAGFGAALSTSIVLQASPAASTSLGAALTAHINLAASPAATAGLGGALSTAIMLAAAPVAGAGLGAQITTTIQLQASPAATAGFGALLSAGSSMDAHPGAVASLGAALSTSIVLAAAPGASASLGAALSVPKLLSASPAASAGLGGTLSTAITLAAAPTAGAGLGAALSTQIALAASPAASASIGAALLTSIRLSAAPAASAGLGASLTGMGQGIGAVPAASASMGAALSTQIRMASVMAAGATMAASLSTQIRLDAVPAARADLVGVLSTQIRMEAQFAAAAGLPAPSLDTAILLDAAPGAQAGLSAALTASVLFEAYPAAMPALGVDLRTGRDWFLAFHAAPSLGADLTTFNPRTALKPAALLAPLRVSEISAEASRRRVVTGRLADKVRLIE